MDLLTDSNLRLNVEVVESYSVEIMTLWVIFLT